MKILSASQIKEADQYTIKQEPITSIDLMERASTACVNWLTERFDTSHPFVVYCGKGNNGGDGLAIARQLSKKNYHVDVFIMHYSSDASVDFLTNLDRIKKLNNITISDIHSFDDYVKNNSFKNNTIVIDAILGSGINRPIEEPVAQIVDYINRQNNTVIAIDIPSGLYCDKLNSSKDIIMRATNTLTFQSPKLSFMLPETTQCTGTFSVLDIGLNNEYIQNATSSYYFVTQDNILGFLKQRNKAAHKGHFGHSLIVAGSYGKTGAAVLATSSCLRSGAGLVTAYIPKTSYHILQSTLSEAMVETDSNDFFISDNLKKLNKYDAIGIGPGIGIEKDTQNVVKTLIQNTPAPLVFDADAINILSENKTWLSFIPAGSILTPHPKEFERLTEKSTNSFERLMTQRAFSIKYNAYVVLKGPHTSVSCPDGNIYFNSTGNPGMATAGSGDVLTGIITSLLGQGYTSQQACLLGVYIHGLAGDFAALEKSEESMIASDIINNLGNTFLFLHSK